MAGKETKLTLCEPEKVTEVARLVGPVQPQIYGEAWDVIAQEGAINIAEIGRAHV